MFHPLSGLERPKVFISQWNESPAHRDKQICMESCQIFILKQDENQEKETFMLRK